VPNVEALDAGDIRRSMPRFQPDSFARNLGLLEPYRQIATEQGCTPAQLALAWLLQRDEHIIPIPGTTSLEHLHDNVGAARVHLSDAAMAALDALINTDTVHGRRYGNATVAEVDSEEFL
jgi:aryl-alcohol dehydrogenase-like predicted oxidoreductase